MSLLWSRIKSIKLTPYLFILPAMLILGLIYLYPILRMIWFSFTDKMFGLEGAFIGVGNYIDLVDFIPTIERTLIWTFGSIIPAMMIGLAGALLFNRDFCGKRLVMTLCLLPYAIPLVIAAFLWSVTYNPSFGLLNQVLLKLGIIKESVGFLSYKYALPSVILVRIWRAVPFAFLMYYSGLQSIPTQLYEAARIDGANRVRRFLHITLPQLKSVTLVVGIILTVWTTILFDIVFVLTGGGPINATLIIPIDIYETTFGQSNVGLASAKSVVTIFVLFLISTFYWAVSKRGEV